jgi:DMSO/TMAO reductase YedYZ heme-binding membrane subunit
MGTAEFILLAAAFYTTLGVVFGVLFITSGAGRVDHAAIGAPWSFRLLILPGAAALWPLILLHVILCIGPLARLDRRVLPLLYNRRHLGVMTLLIALVHAVVVLGFYHGFGNVNPFLSLLRSNTNFTSLRAFPFQILGVVAMVIMFLMAATSHDFWLKNHSAATWKRLHMLVYVAYALLVGHVALGALQNERSSIAPTLMFAGVLTLRSSRSSRTRSRCAASTPHGGNSTFSVSARKMSADCDLRPSAASDVPKGWSFA